MTGDDAKQSKISVKSEWGGGGQLSPLQQNFTNHTPARTFYPVLMKKRNANAHSANEQYKAHSGLIHRQVSEDTLNTNENRDFFP